MIYPIFYNTDKQKEKQKQVLAAKLCLNFAKFSGVHKRAHQHNVTRSESSKIITVAEM